MRLIWDTLYMHTDVYICVYIYVTAVIGSFLSYIKCYFLSLHTKFLLLSFSILFQINFPKFPVTSGFIPTVIYICITLQNRMYYLYIYFRWPRLKMICQKNMHNIHINFKQLVRARITCRKQLVHYLAYLSEKCYKQIRWHPKLSLYTKQATNVHICLEDLNMFVNVTDIDFMIQENNEGHGMNYYFLTDELTNFLEQSQR